MPRYLPDLDFASLSDVGQRRLANEDACHCDTRMNLFVVCDGIGGQPSGEAASQIIAHALGHQVRRHLRRVASMRPGLIEDVLVQSVNAISDQLYKRAEATPVLVGMGATIVGALIDARTAYVVHAGDSRCYLLRDGAMRQVTTDHTRSYRTYRDEAALTSASADEQSDKQADLKERRLLQSFVGAKDSAKTEVSVLPLRAGDRLLLCSDGLTDPTDEPSVERALLAGDPPQETCRKLVKMANAGGGPDNITAIVIDYRGLRPYEAPLRLAKPKPDRSRQIVATWFKKNLERIEQTLRWLREGAAEAGAPEVLRAMAAVKRRLGQPVFRQFLEMNPAANPAHVFHRVCASPDCDWRKQYTRIMADLEPNFRDITDGTIRISPILSAEETGKIIASLWHDWRKVEKRYFNTCNRDAISESEATLNILIDHMHTSVRTLIGLLEFFPRFQPELPPEVSQTTTLREPEASMDDTPAASAADSAAPV